ncbi:MAG: flagellin [Methanomicrobiales archaeon]|nr:flagellin [Methanomicrobiales archaeon]
MTDEDAFTGLEAAILLITSIVVAAVFTQTILSAGFLTTQKSQEAAYSGAELASSSLEIIGDVYGIANGTSYLNYTKFTLILSAGQTPLDITKMNIAYIDESKRWSSADYKRLDYPVNATQMLDGTAVWGVNKTIPSGGGNLGFDFLEPNEQVVLFIGLPTSATPDTQFSITIFTADRAVLPIVRRVPSGLDTVNILR